MTDHEHEWIDTTGITDPDQVLVCKDCGAEERTTPTGRTTITIPDGPRKVTGL